MRVKVNVEKNITSNKIPKQKTFIYKYDYV